MAPKAILCDLDGTVWDSFPWYSSVLARATSGSADFLLSELRQGFSVVTLCRRLGVTDTRFRRLCGVYGDCLRLFPGVREALMQLNSRRIPTAVVTSLPARIAEPLLDCVRARDFFSNVVNASNCPSRKPSPGPLIFALGRIGVVPNRDVFYVGDQPGDGAAADAAGISFAWASYGYGGDRPGNTAAALKSFSEVLLL